MAKYEQVGSRNSGYGYEYFFVEYVFVSVQQHNIRNIRKWWKTTGSHRYDMYDKKGLLEIALPLTYVSVAVSLLEACTTNWQPRASIISVLAHEADKV